MSRFRSTAFPLAAALMLAGPALAQAPDAPPPPGAHGKHHAMAPHPARLNVSGTGQAVAQPDIATITLGVSAQADTAAEAMRQTAEQQQKVIDTLKTEGIEPRDIQTSGLNLSARMDYPENQAPKLVGYAAQNTVTVRMRDISKLGVVLDKLVASGANEISGIGFSREDMREAEDEARAAAVKDARHKAELMAEAAGMRLGALRMLADSPMMQPPQPVMLRAAMADAKMESTPVEAGELAVTAQVSATFDLLPAGGPGAEPPPPPPAEGEVPPPPAEGEVPPPPPAN